MWQTGWTGWMQRSVSARISLPHGPFGPCEGTLAKICNQCQHLLLPNPTHSFHCWLSLGQAGRMHLGLCRIYGENWYHRLWLQWSLVHFSGSQNWPRNSFKKTSRKWDFKCSLGMWKWLTSTRDCQQLHLFGFSQYVNDLLKSWLPSLEKYTSPLIRDWLVNVGRHGQVDKCCQSVGKADKLTNVLGKKPLKPLLEAKV